VIKPSLDQGTVSLIGLFKGLAARPDTSRQAWPWPQAQVVARMHRLLPVRTGTTRSLRALTEVRGQPHHQEWDGRPLPARTRVHVAPPKRLAMRTDKPEQVQQVGKMRAFAGAHFYAPASMFARGLAGEPEFRKRLRSGHVVHLGVILPADSVGVLDELAEALGTRRR
jgi:hypothetical protein